MIKLEVKDYCQNCPDFKPVTEQIILSSSGRTDNVNRCTTYIHCKHENRCANIYRQIIQEKGELD